MSSTRPTRRPVVQAVRTTLRPFARAVRAFRGVQPPPPDPFKRFRDPRGPSIVAIPPLVRVAAIGGTGRVTLLVPGLEMARMTGGPNTALNLVARLAEHGVALRFVAALTRLDDDPADVQAHIEQLSGVELASEVELVEVGTTIPLEVAPDDIFIATSWPTAHIAERARRLTAAPAFVYLIQDYEPGFYPFSTSYALAAATYRMPTRAIFNERLLLDHFRKERIGRFGDEDPAATRTWTSFEPAVDRRLFRPGPHAAAHRRLLFYARPGNQRNCFDLGLRALRMAVAEGAFRPEEWEIASIGATIPALDLGGGRTLKPTPWMSYSDYATYIAESDVMLSLMLSPHTSYPPLEMAATGGRVVTNVFSVKTAEAMQAISPSIDAVEPDPDAVAAALVRAERAAAGGQPAWDESFALPASWDDAFRDTVPWLVATLAELAAVRAE
jgi:O-antigen biosynthesis protein